MYRLAFEKGHSEAPKPDSREDELDALFADELKNQVIAEAPLNKYVSFEIPDMANVPDKNKALMNKIYYANGDANSGFKPRCDIFLSIHCDWASRPQPKGFEIFYNQISTAIDKELAQKSKLLAEFVARQLINDGYSFWGTSAINEDHLVAVGNLAVCSYTKMPAILIELGFLTNPDDSRNLENPQYRSKYCASIYQGIKSFCERA